MTDIAELLKELKTGGRLNRALAAGYLGSIGDSSAVPDLLVALKDEDETVRLNAAEALGFIRDPAAVPGLIETMVDRNSGIFDHAVYALAEICVEHDPREVHELLKHNNPYIRLGAAYALGEKAGVEGIEGFIDLVRYHIQGGKQEFEVAGEGLIKIGRPAVPALIEALIDDEDDVRRCAIWVLGEIADPVAVPALINALQRDEEGYIQQEIVWALTQIGNSGTPEALAAVEEWRGR